MSHEAANQPNLSESLQLHFVLAEQQLHLLQLVLQSQVLLQYLEVQLEGNTQTHTQTVRTWRQELCTCRLKEPGWCYSTEFLLIFLMSLLGCIPVLICLDCSDNLLSALRCVFQECLNLFCVKRVTYVPFCTQLMSLPVDSHCRDTQHSFKKVQQRIVHTNTGLYIY